LEIEGHRSLIKVCGQVIRCHATVAQKYDIYIAFRDNPTKSEAMIREIVQTQLEYAKQHPTILVLATSRSVQGELKKEIISAGHNVVSTGTKQEAVWLLQDVGFYVDILLVDPYQDAEEGYRFLKFLSTSYPELRIILFSESETRHPDDEERFQQYAHAVLSRPWTRQAIESAIGL
jgi:hypothetical protein